MDSRADLHRLFAMFADNFAAAATRGEIEAEEFRLFASALRQANGTLVQRPPRQLPVCRYWLKALARAEGTPAATLAAALRPFDPALQWIQNPNYTAASMGAGFVENYGYADLLGPRGLMLHDQFAVGVLLLGPDTTYPPHHHPAIEVYCVVGGVAEWQREDGPWTKKPSGSLIYHPSGLAHATRTGADPLLALYLWRGHLGTPATLKRVARPPS
jgi:quercetin dioxygenase-like cupin family protein